MKKRERGKVFGRRTVASSPKGLSNRGLGREVETCAAKGADDPFSKGSGQAPLGQGCTVNDVNLGLARRHHKP